MKFRIRLEAACRDPEAKEHLYFSRGRVRCFFVAGFVKIRCDSVEGIRILTNPASAPVKAFDQEGESPFQANVTSLNNKSNCVAVRQGGEQLELNDQSVTK